MTGFFGAPSALVAAKPPRVIRVVRWALFLSFSRKKPFRNEHLPRLAKPLHEAFPALVPAQDLDLHAQIIDRGLQIRDARRKTHAVFFRRHDEFEVAPRAPSRKFLQFAIGEA